MNDLSLILLAAGDSTRFNCEFKKQNLYIDKVPLWLYVAKNFKKMYAFKEIIITCNEPYQYEKLSNDFIFVKGANTRGASIKNALKECTSQYVMISDVARLLVKEEVLNNLLLEYKNYDCVFSAIKLVDTLYNYKENKYENRDDFLLVQTPQISKVEILKKLNLENYSDESSAFCAAAYKCKWVQGDYNNFKLTFKSDLKKLKNLNYASASKDNFIGYGYDVHEFCSSNVGEKLSEKNINDKLILGGICCADSKYALKANSDADVLSHAIIDAMLGACNLGDIGELFSPDDLSYRKADSIELLKIVYKKCKEYGFYLSNLDISIAAQVPKINPFKKEIQKNLQEVLKCKNINIKATTTERLGFVGRCEGISVSAVCNMRLFDWSCYEDIDC